MGILLALIFISRILATKKNKEVLNLENNCNFKLIAISAQLNINKLVWELNSALDFKLVRNADLEKVIGFPTFSFRNIKSAIVVSLIQNMYEGKMLVKQLSNVDYVFEFTGELLPNDFKAHMQVVKKIPNVIAAIEIVPSSIKRNEPFCPE